MGQIGEFDRSCETFKCYSERIAQYFIANDIKDEKKVAVFLSVMGSQTYGLLKNLLALVLPSTKSFAETDKGFTRTFLT